MPMLSPLLPLLFAALPAPAVAVVAPADARGADSAAVARAAVDAAGAVATGPVVAVPLPAGPCDLRCRLDAARGAGAPLVLLVDTGTLGDGLQVGVVLVDLESGRAVAQAAERVAAKAAAPAAARCVRAALGKADAADAAAKAAAAAALSSSPLRLVVAPPKLSSTLGLDAAAATALSSRAATVAAQEPGLTVVSTDEVAAVLKNDRDKADLGAGDASVFARAATALDARLLLLLDVGGFGDAALVTARLVDVKLGEAETQRAELVVDDPGQIPVAVDAVVAQLFGRMVKLPAPRAVPSRFEAAVKRVARGLTPAFLDENGKAVAVLPFDERGEVPTSMKVGGATATLLWKTLSDGLAGPTWLPVPPSAAGFDDKSAAVVVRGAVSDVGTDLLIEATAVDVADGSVRARQTALFPKGDQATLIPVEKLVLKTRGEALFRAIVPGGGQFFNGPEHTWKGVVVAAGTGLGLAGGAALLGLSAWAAQQSALYDVGGEQAIALGCARDAQGRLPPACEGPRKEFEQQADALRTGALAAFVGGGAFYVAGLIDAGWSAE
jgi:hypothetical protein